jgi:aspartyl/asparaginyl beta-hydroxylase (cupin superfamily)
MMILLIIFAMILLTFLLISLYFKDKMDLLNRLFEYYCNDPAVFDSKDIPWTKNFRDNWKLILQEYLEYSNKYSIPNYTKINEITSSCDVNNRWKTLFLRIFNADTNITHLFPQTMQLIKICPCTLAFFSVFEPGTKLTRHRGVYKGVIRYHLPLIVPDEWDKCFINVNGRVLNWQIGSDLVFDDRFLHHAENNTNQVRVVLFLDIKRDFKNPILNFINTIFLRIVKSNDMLIDTLNKANNLNLNVL